jgi:hypothetical protein
MRWMTNDPKGFGAGDLNLYRDLGNGPVNGTDPSGLRWVWEPTGKHRPAPYNEYRLTRVPASPRHRAYEYRNPNGRWAVRVFYASTHDEAPNKMWLLDRHQPSVSGVYEWTADGTNGPHQEEFEYQRRWEDDPRPVIPVQVEKPHERPNDNVDVGVPRTDPTTTEITIGVAATAVVTILYFTPAGRAVQIGVAAGGVILGWLGLSSGEAQAQKISRCPPPKLRFDPPPLPNVVPELIHRYPDYSRNMPSFLPPR